MTRIPNRAEKDLMLSLFDKCLYGAYVHVEEDGSFALKTEGDTLYILFQKSNGWLDWKHNFDFPAVPYKDMEIEWYCHRGFLKVWKAIEPYLRPYIMDPKIKSVYVVGYSHGAAIATLCHEYVWFNRPDLRESLNGYGFGCPKVFFGYMPDELKARWARFNPIRNINDLFTFLPPLFRHVNTVVKIGKKGEYDVDEKTFPPCIYAHYPNNYQKSLKM